MEHPTKRQLEIAEAAIAGYEDDGKTFMRLFMNAEEATPEMILEAWKIGQSKRKE